MTSSGAVVGEPAQRFDSGPGSAAFVRAERASVVDNGRDDESEVRDTRLRLGAAYLCRERCVDEGAACCMSLDEIRARCMTRSSAVGTFLMPVD